MGNLSLVEQISDLQSVAPTRPRESLSARMSGGTKIVFLIAFHREMKGYGHVKTLSVSFTSNPIF